jgi:hypothetical protein
MIDVMVADHQELFRVGMEEVLHRHILEFQGKLEQGVHQPPQYPSADTDERRKSVRYPITVAVSFQWQVVDGRLDSSIGTTRDIGKAGLFVESESVPPVDSVLKLIVTLPALGNFDTTLHLAGTAVVRYVQQDTCQTSGFGAVAVFRV